MSPKFLGKVEESALYAIIARDDEREGMAPK